MCIVTPEATYLLLQPNSDLSHQVFIALIPQLVSMCESARHTSTVRLDGMLSYRFGIEWRQFAVPVDYFAAVAHERPLLAAPVVRTE
jgi:hypothetical protein